MNYSSNLLILLIGPSLCLFLSNFPVTRILMSSILMLSCLIRYTQRHPWYPGLLMDSYILKGTVRSLLSHNHFIFAEQLSRNPHDQVCYRSNIFVKSCPTQVQIDIYIVFDITIPSLLQLSSLPHTRALFRAKTDKPVFNATYNFIETYSFKIHDCFCWSYEKFYGAYRCTYGMPTVTYAAWDPAFLFHHSAIDRLFVMRRELEEEFGVSDWTSSRVAGQYVTVRYLAI